MSFKPKKNKRSFILLIFFLLLATGFLAPELTLFSLPLPLKEQLLTDPEAPEQKTADLKPVKTLPNVELPPAENAPETWYSGAPSSTEEKTLTVSSGDTLMGILLRARLNRSEAHEIITVLKDMFEPRRLCPGQEITLALTEKEKNMHLKGMNIKIDASHEIRVLRGRDDHFTPREITRQLQTRPAMVEAKIDSSLYQAALDAEMPIQVLTQIIRAYSFDVDFQRDIRSGDRIEVMYKEKIDEQGQILEAGAVLLASLKTRGRDISIYRYETSDGETDFFDAQGRSVRKTLMITPIDGARLSSGYGKRRHPILGYNKMHHGLDFAAPMGTPIMAAGNGIVEYAGRKGTYGHYIRIRHSNQYHTVYAHLSRYARGIRKGARIKQGETIGYVGSTGRSTGPHLHYEVHHKGHHVNPATVNAPPGRILEGEELQRFRLAKQELETRYVSLRPDLRLARKVPEKVR
ncbi:MAG: peptidoglycan DD-metalloendopeptidase family protein [Desulfatiglandaceae bacterium]